MTEDSPQQRRQFFRESLSRMIGPLANYLERRIPGEPDAPYLRPPGAIDEDLFVETCHRSGLCIAACPADAIRWLRRPDEEADETPVVAPDIAACVICDGLKCTHACPSGAILPLPEPHMIRMGLAVMDSQACVRSRGEPCRICVDQCPIGRRALRLNDAGPPEVLDTGCVGCGVCQQHCPTSPKSITVAPR